MKGSHRDSCQREHQLSKMAKWVWICWFLGVWGEFISFESARGRIAGLTGGTQTHSRLSTWAFLDKEQERVFVYSYNPSIYFLLTCHQKTKTWLIYPPSPSIAMKSLKTVSRAYFKQISDSLGFYSRWEYGHFTHVIQSKKRVPTSNATLYRRRDWLR